MSGEAAGPNEYCTPGGCGRAVVTSAGSRAA
jgi:hypothetical protein